MKTFVVLVIIMAGLGYVFLHTNKSSVQKIKSTTTTQSSSPTVEPSINPQTTITSSIFVPYWTVDTDLAQLEYDRLIYFGVTADNEGIDTHEPGYAALDTFIENAGAKEKYLTLRLLNNDFNQDLLSDSQLQKKIIDKTLSLAKEKGFDGVVLDLELSNIPLEDLSGDVSTFIGKLYSSAQKQDLRLSVAIYGDTFYRKRPFDLNYIGTHTDEVMVMAYDFSKSYGEPGPNFPLNGADEYGYDFQEMVSDFSQSVSTEKLVVIFGMYGYDWTLGPQGKPLKQATAVTLNQVQTKFVNTCQFSSCKVSFDSQIGETKVKYRDDEGYDHLVWFENENSVNGKIAELRKKGIYKVSYWAYGYF